jgi:hypothetical protein
MLVRLEHFLPQIGTCARPTKPWQSHAHHPPRLLPLNWAQKIIIFFIFQKWWLLGMIQFTEMLSSFRRDFLSVSERKSIGCYRLMLDDLPVKKSTFNNMEQSYILYQK